MGHPILPPGQTDGQHYTPGCVHEVVIGDVMPSCQLTVNADGEVAPLSDREEAQQRPCDDSVRRPSSDRATTANARRSGGDNSEREEAKQRRSAMRGTRETIARQPYAMAHRGSQVGDVRMCARTHESARDTCTQWQCRPTDVYNWVGWTHPHPLRYCWMHANLSILYFCIIAFNCFSGNKCCVLPCRLSRESFHRVKEPQQLCWMLRIYKTVIDL